MYTITFEDGTKYQGGNLLKSGWNSMPTKPIKEWVYQLAGKQFKMSGYEEYNHIVERVNVGGQEIITKVILMGRVGQLVESYMVDLQLKRIFSNGNIIGTEYQGKSVTGWKTGVRGIPTKTLTGAIN